MAMARSKFEISKAVIYHHTPSKVYSVIGFAIESLEGYLEQNKEEDIRSKQVLEELRRIHDDILLEPYQTKMEASND